MNTPGLTLALGGGAAKGLAHITGGGLLENPPRILRPGLAMRLDPQAWERLLDRYYELHGWDSEGMPEKDTLARLGLEEIGIRLYEDR